jgi:signal transduction histidine kinase
VVGEERLGHVLVLEDDKGVVRLIQLRLQRLGYQVASATTPIEAMKLVDAGGIDLVVLDYRLEGEVGGLDFHRQLKAAGYDIPAILITGFSHESKVIEAIRAGVRDFVPKTPEFLDDLGPAVERVMEQVRVNRQAAESESVRRNNQQLQQLIQERQRLEDELRASNAQLIEADRRKNEFLAMLAHELRNPLAAIRSAIQLLLKTGDEHDRAWSQEVVDRQSRHLGRLIDDLLDISRITQGKITLRKERLTLEHAVRHAVDTVWPMFKERGQTLEVSPIDPSAAIYADPTRIEQVLVNLLSNAAKYTDNGGRIQLNSEVADSFISISVADNGVGISPEMIARVFDLFSQVDHSLARSRGGLGIGLTLVRQLVELHGGIVEAASEGPGKGTTMSVRLPLIADDALQTQGGESIERPERHGVKVLIVDDNVDAARSMSRFLRLKGYDVQTVGDGYAALEVLGMFHPAAVLLDIGLPGMDGYQVAEAIRSDPTTRATTLISISGYSLDTGADRDKAFDRHLVKPVDFDALLRLLGTL